MMQVRHLKEALADVPDDTYVYFTSYFLGQLQVHYAQYVHSRQMTALVLNGYNGDEEEGLRQAAVDLISDGLSHRQCG